MTRSVHSPSMDEAILDLPVYGLSQPDKTALLTRELRRLSLHHIQHCPEYSRLLRAYDFDPRRLRVKPADFPPLATRLFKHYDLKSIPDAEVFKTLLSSGTGGKPSRIYLDRRTAALQSKALVRIMQHWLGKARLPMLIADNAGIIKDRKQFSARGAGILGLSMMGRDHTYALHEDMSFDLNAVSSFAKRHGEAPVLIFGFTYMVWQFFITQLIESGVRLPGGILLHGGGWKKLQERAVDNAAFKARIATAGISRVHNYYGLVEQTGAIFVECEYGYLHAPVFADVIVRDAITGLPTVNGKRGMLELLSMLPHSYPGHVLLTEDLGRVLGEDDCPCGRKGRYFEVLGRIPRAEARGCSDTLTLETT